MAGHRVADEAVCAGLSVYRTLLRVSRQAPQRDTALAVRHVSRAWFEHAQESWNRATKGRTVDPSPEHLAAAARRRVHGLASARWLHEGFANRGMSRRLARTCFDVRRHRAQVRARRAKARREFADKTGKELGDQDANGVPPGHVAWARGMHTLWHRYGVVTQHPLPVSARRHADRAAARESSGAHVLAQGLGASPSSH